MSPTNRPSGEHTAEYAAAAWNEAADWWNELIESESDEHRFAYHGPALASVCGDVAGLRAVDIGCGQGYFTRELARRGARVVGVDISDRLISHARRHEEESPLGIEYVCMDAAGIGERWPESSFDLATACMALADIPDLAGAVQGAHTILVPGGRLVFTTAHPCGDPADRGWERREDGTRGAVLLDHYFDTGVQPKGINQWRAPGAAHEFLCWQLTLEEWSRILADAGFRIRGLSEPRPSDEMVARFPRLEPCQRVPHFLTVDAEKPR